MLFLTDQFDPKWSFLDLLKEYTSQSDSESLFETAARLFYTDSDKLLTINFYGIAIFTILMLVRK